MRLPAGLLLQSPAYNSATKVSGKRFISSVIEGIGVREVMRRNWDRLVLTGTTHIVSDVLDKVMTHIYLKP